MLLYIAGNFAVMGNSAEEKKFRATCGARYTRLCSFFYTKEANVVVDLEKSINKKVTKKKKKKKGGSK